MIFSKFLSIFYHIFCALKISNIKCTDNFHLSYFQTKVFYSLYDCTKIINIFYCQFIMKQ